MGYEPKSTIGGNRYLGPNGTFSQLVAGLKWIAEGRDAKDAEQKAAWEQYANTAEADANTYTDEAVAGAKAVSVPRARQVDTGMNLDLMVGASFEGDWSMGSVARAETVTNKPPGALQGTVRVFGGIGYQWFFEYVNGQVGKIWVRGVTNTAGPLWSEWTQIFPVRTAEEPKYAAGYGVLGHETRKDFALRKLGGTIGTAGRAAFALRFDDNPAAFRDKVLPVLKDLDLPGYIASATRYYTETGVAYSTVESWAVNSGVSIANHTKTHGDSTTDDAIWDNTVGAADELEAAMPKINVDVWTMPSISGTKMNGYDDGRYPTNFIDTTAGRAIASRHAVVNGYSGGRLQPLIGRPTFGQTHLTIEAMDYATFKSYVDEAVAAGMGLTLMLHPSRLDTTGYMTTTVFTSCLEYLAQLRDTGAALVLGPLGIGFADQSHGFRRNLVRNGDFAQGFTNWVYTTGWTVTNSEASTATGAPIKQKITLSPDLAMRGATMELVAKVNGTTGDVIRTNVAQTDSGLTANKDHTLEKDGWQEVRKCFTLPTTTPFNGVIDIYVGRISGGTVSMRDVRMHTV